MPNRKSNSFFKKIKLIFFKAKSWINAVVVRSKHTFNFIKGIFINLKKYLKISYNFIKHIIDTSIKYFRGSFIELKQLLKFIRGSTRGYVKQLINNHKNYTKKQILRKIYKKIKYFIFRIVIKNSSLQFYWISIIWLVIFVDIYLFATEPFWVILRWLIAVIISIITPIFLNIRAYVQRKKIAQRLWFLLLKFLFFPNFKYWSINLEKEFESLKKNDVIEKIHAYWTIYRHMYRLSLGEKNWTWAHPHPCEPRDEAYIFHYLKVFFSYFILIPWAILTICVVTVNKIVIIYPITTIYFIIRCLIPLLSKFLCVKAHYVLDSRLTEHFFVSREQKMQWLEDYLDFRIGTHRFFVVVWPVHLDFSYYPHVKWPPDKEPLRQQIIKRMFKTDISLFRIMLDYLDNLNTKYLILQSYIFEFLKSEFFYPKSVKDVIYLYYLPVRWLDALTSEIPISFFIFLYNYIINNFFFFLDILWRLYRLDTLIVCFKHFSKLLVKYWRKGRDFSLREHTTIFGLVYIFGIRERYKWLVDPCSSNYKIKPYPASGHYLTSKPVFIITEIRLYKKKHKVPSKKNTKERGKFLRQFDFSWPRYDWDLIDKACIEKQELFYKKWFKRYPKIKDFFINYLLNSEWRYVGYYFSYFLLAFIYMIEFIVWFSKRTWIFIKWSKFYQKHIFPFLVNYIKPICNIVGIVFGLLITIIFIVLFFIINLPRILVGVLDLIWSLPVELCMYLFSRQNSFFNLNKFGKKNKLQYLFFNKKEKIKTMWKKKRFDFTESIFFWSNSIYLKFLNKNIFIRLLAYFFLIYFFIPLTIILQIIGISLMIIKIIFKFFDPTLWIKVFNILSYFAIDISMFCKELFLSFKNYATSSYFFYVDWYSNQFILIKDFVRTLKLVFLSHLNTFKNFIFKIYVNFKLLTFNDLKANLMIFFKSPLTYSKVFFSKIVDLLRLFSLKIDKVVNNAIRYYIEKKEFIFYPKWKKNKPLIDLKIYKQKGQIVTGSFDSYYEEPAKWRFIYKGYNLSWKNIKRNFGYFFLKALPRFISNNWPIIVTLFIFLPLVTYFAFWELTLLKSIWSILNNIFVYIYQVYLFPITVKFLIIPFIRCIKFLLRVRFLAFILFWLAILLKPYVYFILPAIFKMPPLLTIFLNMRFYELWYWCKKGWYIGTRTYKLYPLMQKKFFLSKFFKIPFKFIAKKKAWFKISYFWYKFYISTNFFFWWTIDSTGLVLFTVAEIFSSVLL